MGDLTFLADTIVLAVRAEASSVDLAANISHHAVAGVAADSRALGVDTDVTGVVGLAVRTVLSKRVLANSISSIRTEVALILGGVAVLEDTASGPVLTSGTGSVGSTPGAGIGVGVALRVIKTSHGSFFVASNKVGLLLIILRVQLEGKTAQGGT